MTSENDKPEMPTNAEEPPSDASIELHANKTSEPVQPNINGMSWYEVHEPTTGQISIPLQAAEPVPPDTSCPHCGQHLRLGELTCPNCNRVIGESRETNRIDESEIVSSSGPQRAGDAIVEFGKPITFEINGTVLNLTIHETLIIGRRAGDQVPDVDLTPFEAEKRGVSRRHAQLKRRGSLIYISDLSSTNGTYLNGRRLIPNGERVLRSDDEVRLGQLKIRVRF